ncbi:centrosome and spindle pole associated protein 1-like [Genypterus blacodes]|uniref:centrosome and spindle pole associated protein 1-like n=1 Tax=Genypterus blacodes TaxID=154954 RepID=UPI003F771F92
MEMDDELEIFIRERKARLLEDKARLEQDPPYMEIRAKSHRGYGSTVKENIPPTSAGQGKEESCIVGLPLGVEYERKKQRLQHELRMDYRRYMAQKKHLDSLGPGSRLAETWRHVKENQAPRLPLQPEDQPGPRTFKLRPSSRREAAALSDHGVHNALLLIGAEEEQPALPPEREGSLGRPVDLEDEEEEELELMEGRNRRPMGVEPSYERRPYSKSDGRDPPLVAREGRRSRAPAHNDVEFATGLLIGAHDTKEVLQRRKERYRQELQEQIAEQHRNRKREKDLELTVAATGANDPEKQPNRIGQFGLGRRKALQVLEPSTSGENGSAGGLQRDETMSLRNGERPPPEQPHVAFQSPLLEYSAALGLGGGGLSPHSQPAAPPFLRPLDTPRLPMFPPPPPHHHPPPHMLADPYRGPYGDAHHYYGTRNMLDPNMAYYAHLPPAGVGPPVSYWNIPPGGAVHSQLGHLSPHSQLSGSSYPEPHIQPGSESAVDSGAAPVPPERPRSARERNMSYRNALQLQIQERQEQQRLEREEEERYEARLEVDRKNNEPWGRGGGGAPLRDGAGNLITDLNQMHKLNEKVYVNPEEWHRKAAAALTSRRAELPDPADRVSGFAHVQTPQFARGCVFGNQHTQQQVHEQDSYKACLTQQIEEKRRKQTEERDRIRLEEEKEEKKVAEQRARIQREYDEEQEKTRRKETELKAKHAEVIQLAEQRKKEVERKRKDAEEKEKAAQREEYEKEKQARLEMVPREPSPPIPTLQGKRVKPRPPASPQPPPPDSRHSVAPPLSERSQSRAHSPPVPACRNQLRAAEDRREVAKELSAVRRHLRSTQKRLESPLYPSDLEELGSLSHRQHERPPVEVFDMARLRLQSHVCRPNSRITEPRNLLQIHDSLQLQLAEEAADAESRAASSGAHKRGEVSTASRRRREYKEPYRLISSHRPPAQDDYLDLSALHHKLDLRNLMEAGSTRGSLLESEGAFIDPLGDAFPAPPIPEIDKPPQLSARERRRRAKQSLHLQGDSAPSELDGQRGDYNSQTERRLQREGQRGGEGSGRDRTGRLAAMSTAADLSDDDSDSHLHENVDRQSSMETIATDPWTRSGTSDTLKFLDRPSRMEQARDWKGRRHFPS